MVRLPSLPISLSRRDPTATGDAARFTIVWLAGEHDGSTKLELGAVIARASDLDGANVLVDLGGVTFMDTSTVGSIVSASQRLAARGLSLQIRAPSPQAVRVLRHCSVTYLVRDSGGLDLRDATTHEPAMARKVHRTST